MLIPYNKNCLDGVIYKYPTIIEHQKFNNKLILDKLTIENKPSVISGDFNLNLIKYTQNGGVNQFSENQPL